MLKKKVGNKKAEKAKKTLRPHAYGDWLNFKKVLTTTNEKLLMSMAH